MLTLHCAKMVAGGCPYPRCDSNSPFWIRSWCAPNRQNENHKITNLSSTNTINIDINEKFFVDKNGQYIYDNEKDINDRYLISGIAFCAEKNSQEIGNEIKEMGLFSNNLIFSYKKMKECLIPPNTEISIIWKIIF